VILRFGADGVGEILSGLVRRAAGRTADDVIAIGLVGRGIQSSRSPVMHEREGARLGLNYSYTLVDFDALGLPDHALGDVLEGARQSGFAGLNITHPFKQAVIRHLDQLAPEAASIGAVNTVVLRDGQRTGHNTDCWGFIESFGEGMAGSKLDKVVQFGAGGAGAAVAYALLELGVADLVLVDTDGRRAEQLRHNLTAAMAGRVRTTSDARREIASADGIVNTTPVGMVKYPGVPFPAELLSAGQWVAEIIYFPEETELLRLARALGCRTLAGTGMAVNQAVRAFELFTGLAADRGAMARHFEAAA
jgi:shikimate dehydrogenase